MFRVVCLSSGVAVSLLLGWLCTSMTAEALVRTAVRAISFRSTGAEPVFPRPMSLSPITSLSDLRKTA